MQISGFRPIRQKNGSMYLPSVEPIVIIGSNAMYVGSVLKRSSSGIGCAVATANTDKMMGYVCGFVVNPGNWNLPLSIVSTNSAYVDGTYTAAVTGDLYTAHANNVTTKQVAALVMYSDDVIVSGNLSAATGTTTSTSKPGHFTDILASSSILLNEAAESTTSAQFLLQQGLSANSALDPNDPAGRRVMALANEIY